MLCAKEENIHPAGEENFFNLLANLNANTKSIYQPHTLLRMSESWKCKFDFSFIFRVNKRKIMLKNFALREIRKEERCQEQ